MAKKYRNPKDRETDPLHMIKLFKRRVARVEVNTRGIEPEVFNSSQLMQNVRAHVDGMHKRMNHADEEFRALVNRMSRLEQVVERLQGGNSVEEKDLKPV